MLAYTTKCPGHHKNRETSHCARDWFTRRPYPVRKNASVMFWCSLCQPSWYQQYSAQRFVCCTNRHARPEQIHLVKIFHQTLHAVNNSCKVPYCLAVFVSKLLFVADSRMIPCALHGLYLVHSIVSVSAKVPCVARLYTATTRRRKVFFPRFFCAGATPRMKNKNKTFTFGCLARIQKL